MNAAANRNVGRGLASLRRITSNRPPRERCELCAQVIGEEHQHLVDPANRRLLCACTACALLFDESGVTHYRRVPRDIRRPRELDISDEFWNGLGIPIGLVFFFRSSAASHVMAAYPSPAGPAETTIEDDLWAEMESFHPSVAALKPDVEALIVNRTQGSREYYVAPIDQCYKLTGIIRRQWQGLGGGDDMWRSVREFFDELSRKAIHA